MKKNVLLIGLSIFFAFIFMNSCKVDKEIASAKINETITVKVSEVATIELASNPSTGYKWEIYKNNNKKVAKYKDNKYTSNGDEGMIGSGGKETWTFETLKKGEATIMFEYKRANDKESGRKITYKIIVTK